MRHAPIIGSAIACSIALAACSPDIPSGNHSVPAAAQPQSSAAPRTEADLYLSPQGFDGLAIGAAVPPTSGWIEDEVQASETCRTFHSQEWPDVHVIVEQGKVRRISADRGSGVTIAQGIGPGAAARAVKQAFGNFTETPHKYIAGGKYLTAPDASTTRSALRFEIGRDGNVTAIHAGLMPQLGSVEGCA